MPCLQGTENDAMMRARLVDSLSRSFPSSALSKALQMACDDENIDPLGSSCFAQIHMEKFNALDDTDDELTSLAWLQDANLLRNIAPEEHCVSPLMSHGNISNSAHLLSVNVPYDPMRHVKNKPPYSFSCLIFMAIEDSPFKRLPVKDIYDWIAKHFPYFKSAPTGWRNSVRHNLSLNKCFKKVDKDHCQRLGKGSSWCIDPVYRPNLLQALRRTPYHPFQQLQMMSNGNGTNKNISNDNDISSVEETIDQRQFPSPELFPFLSKHLSQKTEAPAVSDIEVAKMLTNMSRFMDSFRRKAPEFGSTCLPGYGCERSKFIEALRARSDLYDLVCTKYPSDDHSYSLLPSLLEEAQLSSDNSSVDEGLDVGLESEEEMTDEELASESVSDTTMVDESESNAGLVTLNGRRRKQNLSSQETEETMESADSIDVDADKKTVDYTGTNEEDEEEARRRLLGCFALLDLASGGRCQNDRTERRKQKLLITSSLWGKQRKLSETKPKKELLKKSKREGRKKSHKESLKETLFEKKRVVTRYRRN